MGTKLGDIVRPSNFILIFVSALSKELFMGNDILQPPPIEVILVANILCTITLVHVQSEWKQGCGDQGSSLRSQTTLK